MTGLRSDAGFVEFGVYATPESFPKSDGMIAGSRVPISGGQAVGVFGDLAPGTYALAILLDQFPRNMFRGRAKAFATDAKARAVAAAAISKGFDRALPVVERRFLYLPFEHSEFLADQERAISLFAGLGDALSLDYAIRHRAIIARFGRFPHRNGALGRASTMAEIAFLAQPGSSF